YFIVFSLFLSLASTALALNKNRNVFDTFTMCWENDTFFDTDRYYTNGIKLTLSTPYLKNQKENRLLEWIHPIINRLPFLRNPKTQHALSLSFGQNIYTPEDTKQSNLVENDRPYAGIAYIAFGIHGITDRRKDTWELGIGIVGPHSYAKETLNVFHDWIDSGHFNGWDNQLKDEPAMEVIYETKWRLLRSETSRGFNFELIPHIGGRVGNVSVYANTGMEIRFGWNLPKNFGTYPIQPGYETNNAFDKEAIHSTHSNGFGTHLFAAVDGRAIARDIFLDGNTFRDSHKVDKKYIVADLVAGIGLLLDRFKITYAFVYRTKEFKEQDDEHKFNSITLSYSF
ncbi:lipid A deacylase LpxR family protein, partial [bacterium]|nr:lipid A deacylase LpxR family protein [bacterium]